MKRQLYSTQEEAAQKNYLIAVYHMELPWKENVLKIAEKLAVGQTIGTWTEVPGMTEEFQEKYVGKVVNIYEAPPCELEQREESPAKSYIIEIAYPVVHSAGSIPMLLTCLLGNDASTSAQVKLLDIIFPKEYMDRFEGPMWTIGDLRKRRKAKKRPLLLNMIKPCTGLAPKEGAKIFYQAAAGGADIIKDDELMGNPSYSSMEQRIKEYRRAAEAAYEESGSRTLYFVNITGRDENILEGAKRAQECGADGIMINFVMAGYGNLAALRKCINLPILVHCAGIGMMAEGKTGGMVSSLALGKLTRLCGADLVMMNTPYGGYPLTYLRYIQTYLNLTLPFYQLKKSIPVIGGGVQPNIVEKYISELGTDIILAAGGAIQGHPMGCRAGACAMRQAIECAVEGIPLEEKAKECEELSAAIKKWGKAW